MRTQHPNVPENVLAVFTAYPDHGFLVAGKQRLIRDVADVGKQIAPLGREEVNQIKSLRPGFEQRRRGRQEMDVGVCGYPSLGAEIGDAPDLDAQFALTGFDLQPAADRRVFESLSHLEVNFTHGQLHLERAVHVSERGIHQLHVGAVILEPAVIDLAAMTIGWDIAPFFGAKGQPNGRGEPGGAVDNLAVQPHLFALEDLHVPAGRRGIARLQFFSRFGSPEVKRIHRPRFRVAQRKRRLGTCGQLCVKIAVPRDLLRARTKTGVRGGQPRVGLKARGGPNPCDHTQVDPNFPTVRFVAHRLRQGNSVCGQALIAERVCLSLIECEATKNQGIVTGRIESHTLDDLVGMGIGQRADPNHRRRVGVVHEAHLQVSPIFGVGERVG